MTGSLRRNRRWIIPMLIEAFGDRCCYCRTALTDNLDRPNSRTLDHLIPRSLGGNSFYLNLMLACHRCNSAKGSMMPLDFIASRTRSITNGRPVEDVSPTPRAGRTTRAPRPVDGGGSFVGPVLAALGVC